MDRARQRRRASAPKKLRNTSAVEETAKDFSASPQLSAPLPGRAPDRALFLNRELGVKRRLLEGGGGANGAFLRAGLVDELNLILWCAVSGNTYLDSGSHIPDSKHA
jgi:riboflavin biosynthesis pyrimidine reductase